MHTTTTPVFSMIIRGLLFALLLALSALPAAGLGYLLEPDGHAGRSSDMARAEIPSGARLSRGT